MSKKNSPSYDRTPSLELRRLLSPGEFLAPLLTKRQVAGCDLDVHLRSNDKVHVYCGLARLVAVRLKKERKVDVSADEEYSRQECAKGFFHSWTINKSNESDFCKALNTFLHGVEVNKSQIQEGAIQAQWSQIVEPWIPFDKEAVLGYASKEERRKHHYRAFCSSVEEARNKLNAIARRDHWESPPKKKEQLELDQIAVDSTGNLVLVEIKDASASKPSGVYYAPFQLLHNVWEWYCALDAVRSSLNELLKVRKDLKLTCDHAPQIVGGIRAAIGFGVDGRSEEVKRRYAEVLCVANAHLPPDVPPIETWTLVHGQPSRVD